MAARADVYLAPFASADSEADTFEKDLLQDVMPYAEKFYRISGNADDRAIAGLSMGGGQSLSIGLQHLDPFRAIGAFSAGGRTQNFEEQYKELLADAARSNKKLKVFYIE